MRLTQYAYDQALLQRQLQHPMGFDDSAIKENILALIVEATELLNEVNWKPWKQTRKKLDREKAIEELVDIFHFYVNIMNELNISEEEFDKHWLATNQKIRERIKDGY